MKKFTRLLNFSSTIAFLCVASVAFAQFPPDGGGPGGPGGPPRGPGGGGPGGPGGPPPGGGGPEGPRGPGFVIPIPDVPPIPHPRPPRDEEPRESLTASVQRALARKGYYRGPIDGDLGPGTRAAIRAYQSDRDLPVTGRIDRFLLRDLGLD